MVSQLQRTINLHMNAKFMKMMKSTEYLQERLKIFHYIYSRIFHFANTTCNYDNTTSLQLLYIYIYIYIYIFL